jgi:hypothetical protein
MLCRRLDVMVKYFGLILFMLVFCVATGVTAQTADPKSTAPAAATPQNNPPARTTGSDPSAKPMAPPVGFDVKTGKPYYEEIQEDWSSLSLGVSNLAMEPPLVGEVDDENPHFTRTMLQVKWRPGDPLDLYLILPKGVKKPPVVLYLYNYLDDTSRFRNDGWCEKATSGGFAAVGFVSALSDHRFHDRPMKQWFVSELQESLGSTVHDVKFILDYLASRGDVDMDHVGMFGTGSGGTIAILAAAADPRIKAIDVLEPWGDWPDWLAKSPVVADDPNRAEYVKPEFLKKVAPLDPVKWLPELKSTRIRLQQSLEENLNPIESDDLIKGAAPKQAEVGRYQHTVDLIRADGPGKLFVWVKGQLQASGTAISEPAVAIGSVAPSKR